MDEPPTLLWGGGDYREIGTDVWVVASKTEDNLVLVYSDGVQAISNDDDKCETRNFHSLLQWTLPFGSTSAHL
jgi:hypothetical protein